MEAQKLVQGEMEIKLHNISSQVWHIVNSELPV